MCKVFYDQGCSGATTLSVHHLYTRSDGDQGSFAVLFFQAILEQCGGVHYRARGRSLVSGNAIPMSEFAWRETEFRCMPK